MALASFNYVIQPLPCVQKMQSQSSGPCTVRPTGRSAVAQLPARPRPHGTVEGCVAAADCVCHRLCHRLCQ
eukprot:1074760-Prorocentrum_minimum.AAC.1